MRALSVFVRSCCVAACGIALLNTGPVLAQQKEQSADPAAYALLKEAHDKRDAFPPGFSGLTADLLVNDNGKEVKGNVTYTAAGELKVALNDASKSQAEWAQEQLGSAFAHRRWQDFAQGDGKHPLTFTADDHSPLGRQITLNDRFKSSYRVLDGRISEVTRSMGDQRFTITVLENRSVDGGKYLPSQFIVTYFDAATGAIKQVDAYSDRFTRVSNAWIPSARRVVTAQNGGFVSRSFALSNIHLLGTTAASK